jgi:N-succinyl-L-ornithine transcarbamylase
MKVFSSVKDISNIDEMVAEALELKKSPYTNKQLGENKTLGMIFMNPSLRTRISTQKAGMNLGMNTMVLNVDKDGWALEMEEGAIMNGTTVEHIKDVAAVMSEYCDVIAIRCFAGLKDKADDYSEKILNMFIKYSTIPVVSMEGATLHPLQSFADVITIRENWNKAEKPKVVLTWAPHVKAIPHAVANSFSEWMLKADVDFTITHPEGYELSEDFTNGAKITTDQTAALKDADFVYVKNWSTFKDSYGEVKCTDQEWMLTNKKLEPTNNAKVMHCLPVRRNVEVSDEVLDSDNSLIIQQAANRVYAAQAVIKKMLENA